MKICSVCNGDMGPEYLRYGCQSCNLNRKDTAIDRACRAFGSPATLAKAISVNRCLISQWKRRGGFIPARRQTDIIKAASNSGIELYPADLIQD